MPERVLKSHFQRPSLILNSKYALSVVVCLFSFRILRILSFGSGQIVHKQCYILIYFMFNQDYVFSEFSSLFMNPNKGYLPEFTFPTFYFGKVEKTPALFRSCSRLLLVKQTYLCLLTIFSL
jgi:hypothetical protein